MSAPEDKDIFDFMSIDPTTPDPPRLRDWEPTEYDTDYVSQIRDGVARSFNEGAEGTGERMLRNGHVLRIVGGAT